jgi:hypothetical protein
VTVAQALAFSLRNQIGVERHKDHNMHDDGDDAGDGLNVNETPESAAHYIAAMTGELAKIARRNGLDALGYILEMARIEADQIING